jgi:hypothetical protein
MWAEVDGERKKVAWYVISLFFAFFLLSLLSHFDYGHCTLYKRYLCALHLVTECSSATERPYSSYTCTCLRHGVAGRCWQHSPHRSIRRYQPYPVDSLSALANCSFVAPTRYLERCYHTFADTIIVALAFGDIVLPSATTETGCSSKYESLGVH